MNRHSSHADPKTSAHGGKVENDTNKTGGHAPTQINQGQRTPNSRHDREAHVGSANQVQARKGSGR